MAYEPLHHKYRPQTFAQLVGQGAIAATLSNALRQNRIAPAYLFCGPRGTGKTSSARILAKSLNCINSDQPTPEPCGQCEVCRSITNGSALDVIEIDAASNTGVDNIRELIERAQFAPVQCRHKVYVIDECHMLSTAAFNALLKTLEEPPPHVVFVLATTDPQRVLPTIISRCQRFDFRRIPLEEAIVHLRTIATQENINIADEAVRLVAQMSQGGLRDAESLLDQLSLLEGQVTVERVWDLVGAVPEQDLLTLTQAIAQDNGPTVVETARQLMNRGREPLIVLQSLAGFYRDLLIAKTAGDRQDLVAITAGTWVAMRDFAQSLDLPLLLRSQQHLRMAEAQVKNTTQPRLWLEVTLMGLLPSALQEATVSPGQTASPGRTPAPFSPAPSQPLSPSVAPPPVVATPSPTPSVAATPSSPPPPTVPTSPPPGDPVPQPPPLTETAATPQSSSPAGHGAAIDVNAVWQQIIAKVQPFGTQALLRQQCHLLDFDGHAARIGIKSKPLFRIAQDRLSNIQAAFEQVFQQPVVVSLEVTTAEPPPADQSPPPVTPPRAPAPATPAAAPSWQDSPPPPPPAAPPVPTGQSEIEVPPHGVNPVSPPAPAPWVPESDIDRAVKSFAQFFNGQVVDVDDLDVLPTDESGQRTKPKSNSDVPF